MSDADIEAKFKAAIVESWRVNGRARTVEQGAELAWQATKHLFGGTDALGFVEQTIYANEDSSPSVVWTNAEVLELLRDVAALLKGGQ